MFIVLEGLDGAGKSTQIRMLRQLFADRGVESEYVHFPRFDSPVYGQLIARFLRGEFGGEEHRAHGVFRRGGTAGGSRLFHRLRQRVSLQHGAHHGGAFGGSRRRQAFRRRREEDPRRKKAGRGAHRAGERAVPDGGGVRLKRRRFSAGTLYLVCAEKIATILSPVTALFV